MKTTRTLRRLFNGLLSSARKLFASGNGPRTAPRTCRLGLESLEERAVPSAAQATYLFNREVADCQLAALYVQKASSDATSAQGYLTNGQPALQDLGAAKSCLVDAAQCVIARYQYGYESKAQAQHDLTLINQAYNEVNYDIQAVNAFFSGIGGSYNGVNLEMLPNYFGGANMLYLG
jgi:hypothetical protein